MKKGLFSKFLILALILSMLFSLVGCTAQDAELVADVLDIVEDVATYEEEAATEPAPQEQWDEAQDEPIPTQSDEAEEEPYYDEYLVVDGFFYSPEEVAAYIDTYGCLPDNFITKDEARDLGWESSEGNLWEVADGMCIGGDRFGNREGLLPDAPGRTWYECDVNYYGGYRGGERIVFSSDGLIYYTDDHYESFTLLYE